MRRRSLALALSLLLPASAFAQAQPQAAPATTPAVARSSATVVLTAAPADWRALDGQRVRIAAPLTLAGTDGLERFGQLTVAFDGRLWQPTEVAAPGTAGYEQVMADNQRRRLGHGRGYYDSFIQRTTDARLKRGLPPPTTIGVSRQVL